MSSVMLYYHKFSEDIPRISGTYMAWLDSGIFAEVVWSNTYKCFRHPSTGVDLTKEVKYWAQPPSLNALRYIEGKEI